MCGLNANRVELILAVYLIFLYSGIEDFLIWILHITVGIHEFDNHILCDNGFCWQILCYYIPYTTNRLSAYTYIHLSDLSLKLVFQLLDDAGEALSGFVDIVNDTFADKR